MKSNRAVSGTGIVGAVLGFLLAVSVIAIPVLAWFTHVFTCFKAGLWGFLVAGAIFFPLGIIHGLGIWMGFW